MDYLKRYLTSTPSHGTVLTTFDTITNQMFNEFFKEFSPIKTDNIQYPKVDIYEETNQYVIEAEIPGLTKEHVSVEYKKESRSLFGKLFIKGSKADKVEAKERQYHRRELKRSAFERVFDLDESMNGEAITAEFNNGLLKVCIPKVTKDPKEVVKKIL